MVRAVGIAAVLVLTFALGGWGSGVGDTGSTSRRSAVAVATGGGSDLGNGRPQVTYDGLMVRRRMAIAIRLPTSADVDAVQTDLATAAARRHLALSTVSVTVLDPALLERLAPDLVVVLPAGTTRADAGELVDPASAGGRGRTGSAKYDVVPVLVHDLRFTVSTANPHALSRAIAREGILSDALGNYTTTAGIHRLDIAYTGPLLSDHLVASVRDGIARPAHIAPGAVTVSPRSTTGVGVDMASEPAPAPAVFTASPGHHHGTGDDQGTTGDSVASPPVGPGSPSERWADLLAAAVALLLVLTLVRIFSMMPIKAPEEDET